VGAVRGTRELSEVADRIRGAVTFAPRKRFDLIRKTGDQTDFFVDNLENCVLRGLPPNFASLIPTKIPDC